MAKNKSYQEELEILKEDFDDLKKYLDELREVLPVAICTLTSFWVIVDVNKTAVTLTGYKPLEIIGQPIDFIFGEKKILEKIKKEAERGREIINKETTLTAQDQKTIPVNISLVGRQDREGNLIGYFLTIADITKTKKYQKELEEAKNILEVKVAARTKELKELTERQEEIIKERTKEIQERMAELERFHRLAVGRELKMVELKEEIERLKKELEKSKRSRS